MSNILVVDDQQEQLDLLSAILNDFFPTANILTALTGNESVRIAHEVIPDIILMDIHMPDIDGYEASRQLKKTETTRHIPIVFMSGIHTDAESRMKAINAGAEAFLAKPIDDGELFAYTKLLLRLRQAEDLLRQNKAKSKDPSFLKSVTVIPETGNTDSYATHSVCHWETIFEAVGHPTVILDKTHQIIAANKKVLDLTGKSIEALREKKCYEVFHGPDLKIAPENCPLKKMIKSGQFETVEMEMEALGRYYLVSCTPVLDQNGELENIIHIATDITDRKKIEKKVRNALQEKEILLKEVHHRVKNNLQIITSLLNLQADKIKDPAALEAFEESRNRVFSMSLVHERLYESQNFSSINFKEYVEIMVNKLFLAYEISGRISLNVQIDQVSLGIDAAIPCGLLLNEMVTNSLKHAFPNHKRGKININMQASGDRSYQLVYCDDGVGFPEDIDFYSCQSLGLVLIKVLTQQLSGNIEIIREKGTRFEITFPG